MMAASSYIEIFLEFISVAPVKQLPNVNLISDIKSRFFICFICLEVEGMDHTWTSQLSKYFWSTENGGILFEMINRLIPKW